ncbi:homeobox protein cut-like isoform X1 [Limulus polyphemus]|uniref:Homeobox protein cut-like n=2 Tax=Limulus polyphemus TaxID=6850 RepID=A0ABM1SCF6_LIMPO|nr:homeobox protein cut-like isoform X1 [Limulus polyphemus]
MFFDGERVGEDRKVQGRERKLQREFTKKGKQLQESHLGISKELKEAELKVEDLQSALETAQSELFDLKSTYNEETHTKSNEMEIILNDLERTNQRVILAEKDVSTVKERLEAIKNSLQLAEQIQKTPDMEKAVKVLSRSTLEVELAAKEKEISQLADDIQSLQSTVNNLKQTSASQISHLQERLVEKNRIIHELEEKLTNQKDYDEIKKELSILKSLEFPNHVSAEEDHDSIASEPESISKSTDVHVMEQKKISQPKATLLKVTNPELSGTLSPLENTLPPPLQTVETFGSLLGKEIVSTYTNILKKEDHGSSSPVTTSSTDGCLPITHPPQNGTKSSELPKSKGFSCDHVTLDKLQECLSQCMEKYANETLNTLNISRCVRELLSMHNIGQRLFAKFVLGLSQGTVSELLSKPKPWEKLTEKGKDSFRKMHAWASDDNCIYMLKALVPKKGLLTGKLSHGKAISTSLAAKPTSKEYTNNKNLRSKCQDVTQPQSKDYGLPSNKQDDPGAEERIAQILNEAQTAMLNSKNKNRMSPLHNGSTEYSPRNIGGVVRSEEEGKRDEGGNIEVEGRENQTLHSSSNNYKDYFNSTSLRRSRKFDTDDIPQEMVAKIYQEELAKLMGQRVQECFRLPNDQYERTQEEIRHALRIYHKELSHLSQILPLGTSDLARLGSSSALVNSAVLTPLTSIHHPISLASSYPRQEVPIDATLQSRNIQKRGSCSEVESVRHHGSAFSLVQPKTEAGNSPAPVTISNHCNSTLLPPTSIMSLTEMPNSGEDLSSSASPLQQMQSITNSLLTQSSLTTVSTTPQRPTKAILPPITQQQFDLYNNLNTEEIVKNVKEQLSQYSISQRLFGENVLGLSQGSVSDLLARPKPWHMLTQKGREPFIRMKIFLEDENAVHKLVASQYKIPPEKLMRTIGFGGPSSSPAASMKLPQPSTEPAIVPNQLDRSQTPLNSNFAPPADLQQSATSTPEYLASISKTTSVLSCNVSTTQSMPISSRKLHHSSQSMMYLHPTVYEMAALTTDIDTQGITSKIKDTLMAQNIGQKIFGEVVLGLSQGSVSELLSKPKPWHMLSIKGREPFIRMQLWLNDPLNIERLQVIKNQRREANKRKRNNIDTDVHQSPHNNHLFSYDLPPPSPYLSTKKPRILFSDEQKEALRLAFTLDPYPSTSTLEFLSSELDLPVRTITNWFHNHRMRLKQQPLITPDDHRSNDSGTHIISSGAKDNTNFDPVQFRMMLDHRLAELARDKRSGKVKKMYSTYQNTSPLSAQNDDSGTLDLSMSSQHFPRRSNNTFGFHCTSESAGTDEHSNSEQNEDSSYSLERGLSESSDRESLDDQPTSLSPNSVFQEQEDFKQMTIAPASSSNRRKPAMPQWVDPGLEISPESDLCSENEDNDEEESQNVKDKEIINGVCVLQTGNLGLHVPKEHTVRIEPTPVPDGQVLNYRDKEHLNKDKVTDFSSEELMISEKEEFKRSIKTDRKYNIERLERCLKDQVENWDVDEEEREEHKNNSKANSKDDQKKEEGW